MEGEECCGGEARRERQEESNVDHDDGCYLSNSSRGDTQPLIAAHDASVTAKCCTSMHANSTKNDDYSHSSHSPLLHIACCLGMGLLFLLFLFGRPNSSATSLEAAAAAATQIQEDPMMSTETQKDPKTSMDSLAAARIIGDVVDSFPQGQFDIRISYDSTVVSNGMEFTPSDTASAPRVEIAGKAENGDLYCLVMTDPDAPSPEHPTKREWLHWIVKDIPGTGVASQGIEVVPYNGPTPPQGLHRYAFILFKQLGSLDVAAPPTRAKFSTRRFAAEHNLRLPVAATFFTAQPET